MLSQAKSPTNIWVAIRIVALTMFVVFSMLSHHAGYAAQLDTPAPTAHTDAFPPDHCPGEGCPSHHDGQASCCALGYCGAPLPAPDCAATLLALVSAYPHHLFEIALRWNNRGVDRPPKST